MMNKLTSMRHLLSCRDVIDIVELYSQAISSLSPEKQTKMIENIKDNSKSVVVEEIDSLAIKEIVSLLELYRDDMDFKRFLAHNLREKLVKAANLQIRDLMTTIIETLDMTEQRGEIIRYALNSEIFYAFQVSYLISLLKKIVTIAPYQGQLVTTMPL